MTSLPMEAWPRTLTLSCLEVAASGFKTGSGAASTFAAALGAGFLATTFLVGTLALAAAFVLAAGGSATLTGAGAVVGAGTTGAGAGAGGTAGTVWAATRSATIAVAMAVTVKARSDIFIAGEVEI